jgi:hypothetical protein
MFPKVISGLICRRIVVSWLGSTLAFGKAMVVPAALLCSLFSTRTPEGHLDPPLSMMV